MALKCKLHLTTIYWFFSPCNFISMNISVFLISSLLKRDLTFSLSEGKLWNSCMEREGETERVGEKKNISERLSISTLGGKRVCTCLCVHMLVCAHAYRQADPDIAIKTKYQWWRLVTKLSNFQLHSHPVTGRTVYPMFLIKLKYFI